jgi:uncharacterized phage protein gp47/JayE
MPISLPALADLRTGFRANFAARLAGFDLSLRRSVAGVMSDGQAGGVFSGLRALTWLSRQLFIGSAESPYLDRRLADYGLARIAGSNSSGNLIFTGTATIGVPIGTVLVPDGSLTDTNGAALQFTTTAAAAVGGGGTVSVAVAASGPGAVGNLAAGTALTIVNAIAGVLPVAAVDTGGLGGGADGETDASFRARGLARIQSPPQGGADTDFWAWARATGLPTRAWVFPNNRGAGSADVAFTIDTRANPIPLSADLATVQAAIVAAAPVIGSYQAFAPVADALTITIHNMLPGDSATRAAVTASLVALCASVPPGGATFGDGVTVPLTTGALFPTQVPGTLYLDWINAAINAAATVQSFDLTAPSADVTFATGHLPAVPAVTFT